MNKWKTKFFSCMLVLLFFGMIFSGLHLTSSTASSLVIPESNDLEVKFDYGPIQTEAELASYTLNNSLTETDRVFFAPTEPITALFYNNSRTLHCGGMQVTHTAYPLDLTLRNMVFNDSSLLGRLVINGSPTITFDTVNVEGYIESVNFPSAQTLDNPTLALTSVTSPLIRLRTTGGTMSLSSCTITNMSIAGGLIVTISADSTVTNLFETVLPTVNPTQSSITAPFSFLFQPSSQVLLSWTGQDNIQGPNYGLNYTLQIFKNGVYDSTITNIATTSYSLTIDTAVAVYTIELTATDGRGNVSTKATIVVVPTADLLWLILTIIIIAGAAIAVIFIFYTIKQRQWQKTSLMEIPT